MGGETAETMETQENQVSTDPWAEAFAALDAEANNDADAGSEPGSDNGSSQQSDAGAVGTDDAAKGDDAGADSDESASQHGAENAGDTGGSVDTGEYDQEPDGDDHRNDNLVTQEELEHYRESVVEQANNKAINDVAAEFIKRGVRNTKGKLGASVNDSDICKRDEDGIPHFYNPDTGREFTGDNPRKQAQEWVDGYNNELRNSFNEACERYSQKLLERSAPHIAVLEFAPTYEQLDPVRKSMFDDIVENYEIKDDKGDVVGYSCDLNRALETVNRQVRSIQALQGSSQQEQQQAPSGTGPALDMKSSSSGHMENSKPQFKSMAEALEWKQDQLLAEMRKGDK